MPDFIFSATIDGHLPSKNRRRYIPGKGNRPPMLIKSQEAIDYEKAFMATVKPPKEPYKGQVSLRARVWYRSGRSDLDVTLLKDLIAKAGILANDRQIVHEDVWRDKDAENPRVHFTLYPVEK